MEIDEIKKLSDKELKIVEKRYEERLKYYYSEENKVVYSLILKELENRNIDRGKKNGK